MIRALAIASVVLVGCGPLVPQRDAGSGGGGGVTGGGAATGGGATGGGAGGSGGSGGGATGGGGGATGGGSGGGATGGGGGVVNWTEVALQVPNGTMGAVTRLAAGNGEVFAFVADQYILANPSSGTRFNEVLVFTNPDLWEFQASHSSKAAAIAFSTMLACFSGCESGNNYDQLGAGSARGLCNGSDGLALMTRASDGGTNLYAQDGGDWDLYGSVPLRTPLGCTRAPDAVYFAALGGITAAWPDAGSTIEVPSVTALGRNSANESWSFINTDGTQIFASSVQGAVAIRSLGGTWATSSAIGGEITALGVGRDGDLWVAATGIGLAHFTGGSWSASAGPTQLVSLRSLAVEGPHVYVGGADSSGVARVFRRLR